jgi:3-hydroxyisobutyrate dehydrogenase-like beta-hydroxyacid dehydrogenase
MVVNGEQVEAVVQGEHGLLQTMTSGSILVCSTIALADLHRVAERAAAQGVAVIDSPVSGGVEGAAEGTLTVFCGGDPAIVEAHRPLLQVVGAHVAHLGPLGAGLVGKLANNLILGVGRLAIAEAMAMAKKAGVPLDTLYQTLKTCTADSRLLRARRRRVTRRVSAGDLPCRERSQRGRGQWAERAAGDARDQPQFGSLSTRRR